MFSVTNNGIITTYTLFSIYSLFIALFWTGIFTMAVVLLMKNSFLLRHCSIYTLSTLLTICITRILIPFEIPYTYDFKCRKILPKIYAFFHIPLIQFSHLTVNIGLIIICVWLLIAVLIIFKRIKEYLHFKHTLDIMPASKDQHLYNIFNRADIHNKIADIKIIVHASVQSPAITGLTKPVIILPDISFSDDELLGIFMHEISHYTSKHCFIKLIMEFICAIFWWNPLFKKLASELSNAMELQADKAVCLNLNRTLRKEYLQGIAKVASNAATIQETPPCSCSILEEDNDKKLIQRFNMIAENKYQGKKKLDLIAIPLILAIFLFSYSFTLTLFSEPTREDMEDFVGEDFSEQDTDCYLIEADDGYDLYLPSGKYIDHISINELEYLGDIEIYKSQKEAERERKVK